MNIFWELILPILLVLLVCYFLIPTFNYGVNTQLLKTNDMLNTIVFNISSYNTDVNDLSKYRTDTCSASKKEECSVGTYDQCTNNVIVQEKCDCTDQRSYEICAKNTMDNLLSLDEVIQTEEKDYGKFATRVNQWTVDNTDFNEPTNLHIQRTNPYVEEL